MQRNRLGRSGIVVSDICMGTMTFGTGADEKTANLLLFWGDALLAEGDYRAAVATYGRIAYDVSSPRYWQTADDRRVDVYCKWQASLRAAGESARAAQICRAFLDAYPAAGAQCSDCAP